MFDTMTFTKVLGAFCGALLIFLLGGWAAEALYHTGGGHGHGDDHKQAYVIEVEDSGATEEVVEEVDLELLVTEADISKGERVWGKCRACHKLEDGENGTGPHLFGVVGRQIAAVDGFGYSSALSDLSDQQWGIEELSGFLESPRNWAPGTNMGFSGLAKIEDRANLIAFLSTIQ